MNPKTVEAFTHAHVLWSGSPVVALHAIQEARSHGVPGPSGCDCIEADADGDLRDPVREFEKRYARSSSIGGSDRYVSWYENARLSCRETSSTNSTDRR